MDEQEVLEHRYRFFSEKGVELAVEHDKILVTLFTGIVAGLLALLVSKELGFWSTLFFLLAELSAVVGLAACLMHMAFSAQVMGLFAAMFGGDENVPNLISDEEATLQALTKKRVFAQLSYASQLTCLFWSVVLASLGIVTLVWHVIGCAGFVVALLFVTALVIAAFRPLIWVYRAARGAFEKQVEELANGDESGSPE